MRLRASVVAAMVAIPSMVMWASMAPAEEPSAELARLCDDYWQGVLRASPTTATVLGDHRYDDQLDDNSPAARERERTRLEGVRDRAQKIAEPSLAPADRLTRSALLLEVRNALDQLSCRFDEWLVDARSGPQVDFMNLPDVTVIRSPVDGAHYVARCRRMAGFIDQRIANLRRGLKDGRVASEAGVRGTLDELDSLAVQPVSAWALVSPMRASHPDWPSKDRARFFSDLIAVARDKVRPAMMRYRDFLRSEVLPAARPPEKAGLSALPDGIECYRKCIRIQTSLDRSPEELHQLGLDEVARIRRELSELGGRVLGTTDVAEIQRRLRTDPAMHFRTAEEVEAKARETLARARAAIPNYFGILPKADCQVKVMGMHEAPHSTIAYYQQGAADGSRPGSYMINTYKPETRPRYEAEALAFHESIPGHHLQISIAQEVQGLPEFRKHQGTTAYVEGWALYTERLAGEMGLYSSDLDRIGMLSFDAWRDCRLVVDTGLHAMGWSRQQAIDYMVANTVLAENNIVNEVDRYLGDPGQALAYKCGQLEILALRDEARQKLGARFDLKGFHDVVLENGALALPALREQVEAWIAQVAGRP